MQADQKKRKVEDINARISSKETSKDASQEIKDLEESIKALNARLQEAKKSQPRPLAKAKVKEKKDVSTTEPGDEGCQPPVPRPAA